MSNLRPGQKIEPSEMASHVAIENNIMWYSFNRSAVSSSCGYELDSVEKFEYLYNPKRGKSGSFGASFESMEKVDDHFRQVK